MTELIPEQDGSPRQEARVLMRLAGPAILVNVGTMAMGIVDTLMVSRLGTEALAATSLGNSWMIGSFLIAMGVLTGLDPVIAQAHGRRDGPAAGLALQRGILIALALSVPLALLWCLTGPTLAAFGQPAELTRPAHLYVLARIPEIPSWLCFIALRQYLYGRGIFAPVTWVTWLSNILNVFLNWVLIFGHLGCPAYGVVGAGVASSISRLLGLILLIAMCRRWKLFDGAWTPWTWLAFKLSGLREILRHGIPLGLQGGLEIWSFVLASFLAGVLGTLDLAAHAIALQLASFSFMFPLGIGTASATRIGNLVGAGRLAQARRSSWVSLGLGAAVMAGFATCFLVFRHQLALPWKPTEAVLILAAAVLPVAAAFQLFDGVQVVGCAVLRGYGETRLATWYQLFGHYALGLPLGAHLAFERGMGLPGVWWGLTAGLGTVAVLMTVQIAWIGRRSGPSAE